MVPRLFFFKGVGKNGIRKRYEKELVI